MTGRRLDRLEARISRLEREVRRLRARLKGGPPIPWYREIVGAFAGDRAFAEIARLGRRIRNAERTRVR